MASKIILYDSLGSPVELDGDDIKGITSGLILLADFPARKHNGTITLSEPISNFKEIIVVASDLNSNSTTHYVFASSLLIHGTDYLFWDRGDNYATWTVTNETILTNTAETNSWIRAIYGKGKN